MISNLVKFIHPFLYLFIKSNLIQQQEVQDPTYWSSNHTNGETDICNGNGMSDQVKVVRHFSVNACLAPVASLHGMAVTTVEGIGSTRYVFYHSLTNCFPLHMNNHGQIKFRNTAKK